MKRIICGMLLALLLVAAIGCGGGSPTPVGKTMTNDEVNTTYSTASIGMQAVGLGMNYVADPFGTSAIGTLANSIKTLSVPTYTWSGPDSSGWYTTTETDPYTSATYTYSIRYLEASNTIEVKSSFSMTSGGETVTTDILFSLSQSTDNKWTGSMRATMATTSMGTMKMEYNFTNIDGTAYGSGTYQIWIEVIGGPAPMSRTQYADFTVSYDSAHDPPIHLTGWYGSGSSKVTFPADHWVAIP